MKHSPSGASNRRPSGTRAARHVATALLLAMTTSHADVIVGNDLTTLPASPGGGGSDGDTGSVFIVDGWHNAEGTTPSFTVPAGGGVLTKATILNDTDLDPESVDLLVLRPLGGNAFTVIHRVTVTDDAVPSITDTTDYPLASLPVLEGDVLAHWGQGHQPIPQDCCGSGPGDVQIVNLGSSNFDVGNTVNFAPFPQARSYFWNVTIASGTVTDTDSDDLLDPWELTYVAELTILNGKGAGPGPGAGTGDFDGDGLLDKDEQSRGTNPVLADTDGDTLSDSAELAGAGLRPATDPKKPDTDSDGLSDSAETNDGTFDSPTDTGTDPTKADTDDDALADNVETNDGTFNSPTDTGTNPLVADTDGDGRSDGAEVSLETNPNDPNDPPPLSGNVIGNDLTRLPVGLPDGDTAGGALIIDGFHGPEFIIPAGGGVLTKMTILNDPDETPETTDLLVLRPDGAEGFTVIHRVTIGPDDDPPTTSGTTDYPLADLEVQAGDVLAHWGDGAQPIPADCCGNGPSDIQINVPGENVDVGNTIFFGPFPQKRDYFYNVTLGSGQPLAFTNIVRNAAAGTVDVTWVSSIGKTYRMEYSDDLIAWIETTDSYPEGGATSDRTTYQFKDIPPDSQKRFFKATED